MDVEAVIGFVEAALGEARLSRLQLEVLEQVWEERSYQEIARSIGYDVGYVKQTGAQLWRSLSQTFGEKITKNNVQYILARKVKETLAVAAQDPKTDAPQRTGAAVDWGEAVDVGSFQGRQAELTLLERWILGDESGGDAAHPRCRLMGIFGMGGIGKTCLSVKLAQRLEARFERVIWRSLRNAPSPESLLADMLQFLAPGTLAPVPGAPDPDGSVFNARLLTLLHHLRAQRCLIVLDNFETVMQAGDCLGEYQPGYTEYGQLLHYLGESSHQSTLLLTSREKPKGFAAAAGMGLPIRSLSLTGLAEDCIQGVLTTKGQFWGSAIEWKTLCDRYRGNPLALKIVAAAIQDFFGGQLGPFLAALQPGSAIFGDIRELLASQIQRLSPLEQDVMYWLTIEREPISLPDLQAHLLLPHSLGNAFEALSALERRSLIEKMPAPSAQECPRFTLQPVVMEFMTAQLVEGAYQALVQFNRDLGEHRDVEIVRLPDAPDPSRSVDLGILRTHALVKAQAKDYIRDMQRQSIVQPLRDRLLHRFGQPGLLACFQTVLTILRHQPKAITGYVAGNILNLLAQLANCWEDWDFSDLTIWQADLTSTHLHRCNFQGSDLTHSTFMEACGQILTVAFSPDSQYLATGDVNHELHVWAVADGTLLFTAKVDEGWIWSVAFSPDGRYIAGCANRGVYLWEVTTGACIHHLPGYPDRVFSVAFSPSGRWLATGSEDRLVRIWAVETGELQQSLPGHDDQVRAVAFAANADGRDDLLASGSMDGTVRLWDPASGCCLGTLAGQGQPILSLALSPDGTVLAHCGGDASIHLWHVPSRTYLRSLNGHRAEVRAVAFSPEGQTLASGSDDRTLRLWQLETALCQQVLHGHTSWISAVAFSADGRLLASGSEDQSLRLWDSRSDRCLKTLQGYSNGVWCVASQPQNVLLASGSQDRTINLWDQTTGQLRRILKGHTSWVWAVSFSADGQTLASGSEDRSIKLWDVTSGRLRKTLSGHAGAVFSVLFSADGQTLYSCSLDGTLKVWNPEDGLCLRTWAGHAGGVWALVQSADGELLISGSQDGTLKVWAVQTGQCLTTLVDLGQWVRCCAVSPDGQTLVSGSADGTLKVWPLSTQPQPHLQAAIAGHSGPALAVTFAPNGQTFASCGADNLVKVWDCETLDCLHVLSGHGRWVRSVTYSADGKFLISCGQDATIRIWNPLTGGCTAILHQPRPYEALAIAQVTGLNAAQKANLRQLGANG